MIWNELWSDALYRIRALVGRDAMERDLSDELHFHLERQVEAYERAGMSRTEAYRRARLAFGSVEQAKEQSRDVRGTVLLETMLQDLGYAVRGLRARPGFTAGVVLTLALGIGANAAMFGILDRLMFRPPAYLRDVARVHRLYVQRTRHRETTVQSDASMGRLLDLRRDTRTLSAVAGFTTLTLPIGDGDAAREYPVAGISAEYFGLFDMRPALGRFFNASEDVMPTGTPVAVLGYGYWKSVLGGVSDVIGRRLHVGRSLVTVIGVAPKGFIGLEESRVPSMYLPLTALAWNLRPEDHTRDYHWWWLEIAVERRADATVDVATADVTQALYKSRLRELPGDASWARTVQSERPRAILGPLQAARGPDAGPPSRIIGWVTGVALIVLLIACANVANLLLGRALSRRREIALRLALGVSRGRLVRQLITESGVLAMMGGTIGLAIAQWGGGLVRALFLPAGSDSAVFTDMRTLAAMSVVTFGTAVVTGLAPATQAVSQDLAHSLTAAGRDSGVRRSRLRVALLVLQATLSVILLVGAGLFVRSLAKVRGLRLGYDVDPVLIVTEQKRGVALTATEQALLEQRLVNVAHGVPGVVAATPAPTIPFWSFEGRDLHVAGIDSIELLGRFTMQAGNEDYFRVMGTRLLRGRAFTGADRANAPRVTVVSDRMSRVLWPNENAIGKCIRIGADTMPCTTVVGIAEDLHISSLSSPREFTYYVPIAQYDDASTSMLLVRVAGDAARYTETLRHALQLVMPGAAYVTTMPLREAVDPRMASWRLGAVMFAAFGALALFLAAIGLYGVVAYAVVQRRREMGIRIALGARPSQVLGLVLGSGIQLVALGILLGSVIAAGSGRLMTQLLFEESPTDPVVYIGVSAVLLIVSLVACSVPALAATRIDPGMTLRSD